jgi:hypothetical protein
VNRAPSPGKIRLPGIWWYKTLRLSGEKLQKMSFPITHKIMTEYRLFKPGAGQAVKPVFYYKSNNHPNRDSNGRVWADSIALVKAEISKYESDDLADLSFSIFDETGNMVSYL